MPSWAHFLTFWPNADALIPAHSSSRGILHWLAKTWAGDSNGIIEVVLILSFHGKSPWSSVTLTKWGIVFCLRGRKDEQRVQGQELR